MLPLHRCLTSLLSAVLLFAATNLLVSDNIDRVGVHAARVALDCSNGGFRTASSGDWFDVVGSTTPCAPSTIYISNGVSGVTVVVNASFVKIYASGSVSNVSIRVVGGAMPLAMWGAWEGNTPLALLTLQPGAVLRDVNVSLDAVEWRSPALLLYGTDTALLTSAVRLTISVSQSRVVVSVPSTQQPWSFVALPQMLEDVSIIVVQSSLDYYYAHSGGGPYWSCWFGASNLLSLDGLVVTMTSSAFSTVINGSVFVTKLPSNIYIAAFQVMGMRPYAPHTALTAVAAHVRNCTVVMRAALGTYTYASFVVMRWASSTTAVPQVLVSPVFDFTELIVRIASHDLGCVVFLDSVNATGMNLSLTVIDAIVSNEGPGVYYQALTREVGLVLLGRTFISGASSVSVSAFNITASSNVSIYGDTGVDESRGSTAMVVHVGRIANSTVIIESGNARLSLPFGRISVNEHEPIRLKLVAVSACTLLVDSDVPLGDALWDRSNRFTVDGVRALVPVVAVGVSSAAGGSNGYVGIVVSVGIVAMSLGGFQSHFTVTNATLVVGAILTPTLPDAMSATPPWPAVLFGLATCGAIAIGSTPRNSIAPVYRDNYLVLRNVSVSISAKELQSAINAANALQLTHQLVPLSAVQLLAVSGVHEGGAFRVQACSVSGLRATASTSTLLGNAVAMIGMRDIPASLVAALGAVYLVIRSQLSNTTIVVENGTVVRGGMLLSVNNAQSKSSNMTSHFVVRDGTFVASVESTSPTTSRRQAAFLAASGSAVPQLAAINATSIDWAIPLMTLSIAHASFTGYSELIGSGAVNWKIMSSTDGTQSAVMLRCLVWNGVAWRRDVGIGVPSAFMKRRVGQALDSCDAVSRSASTSWTNRGPDPLQRRVLVGRGMSGALLVATAVASLLQPAIGVLMQRAMSALQMCPVTSSEGSSASDPSTSGSGTAELVAAQPLLTDSPLQLRIGWSSAGTSFPRGTVVGNTVVVCCVAAVNGIIGGIVDWRRQRMGHAAIAVAGRSGDNGLLWRAALWGGLPGTVLGSILLLCQPTLTAAIQCLVGLNAEGFDTDSTGTDAVLGGVGVCLWIGAIAFMVLRVTGERLRSVPRPTRGRRSGGYMLVALKWLTMPSTVWGSDRTREGRVLHRRFQAIVEGYRGGRQWFLAVEVMTAVAFSVVSNVPTPSGVCRLPAILNVVLSACVVLCGLLLPYNGVLRNANYLVTNALLLMGAVLQVTLPGNLTSETLSMISAWLGVGSALIEIVAGIAITGVRSVADRVIQLRALVELCAPAPPPLETIETRKARRGKGSPPTVDVMSQAAWLHVNDLRVPSERTEVLRQLIVMICRQKRCSLTEDDRTLSRKLAP